MKTLPLRRRAGRGIVAGVLAGAVAVGVGQLVAGVTGPAGSPVVAVGAPWLKNFAIREFGGHDKQILVGGILVVLAVLAAVIGVLAIRRLGYRLAGLAVFAAVGVTAAATRPTATAGTVVPTLAAAGVGVIALVALIRAASADNNARLPGDAVPGGQAAGTARTAPVSAASPELVV